MTPHTLSKVDFQMIRRSLLDQRVVIRHQDALYLVGADFAAGEFRITVMRIEDGYPYGLLLRRCGKRYEVWGKSIERGLQPEPELPPILTPLLNHTDVPSCEILDSRSAAEYEMVGA